MMRQPYYPPTWTQTLQAPSHRFLLAHTPTPIQPWKVPGLPEDIECWIKRDDLTGVAMSGNKIRKLEFLLADAQQQGCDIVLTCGGIQSNHCRSTAIAATQVGLDACLFLRTNTPEKPIGYEGNLLFHHMLGAQIVPISYEQYSQRTTLMESFAAKLSAEGRKPYVIPEGGSNALGTWGYIEAVREIHEQLKAQNLEIDDIVFACGSGGTAAGISAASALGKLPWKVHTVNVCDDADYFYATIDRIIVELGMKQTARSIIDVIDGYKGKGYAQSTDEELKTILQVAQDTGIFLDPVYSGKAFFGLQQELQNNPSRFQGKRILFIHTGGLFGLFAKTEQLIPLFSS